MPDWQSVQVVAAGAPLGHVGIHDGDKAFIVARFEEMGQFVHDDVFKALFRFFGQLEV